MFIGIITIDHQTQGCCGEEQIVTCVATNTNRITVNIKNISHSFTDNRNAPFEEYGIKISLLDSVPNSQISGLFELSVELRYDGNEENADLNVTCFTRSESSGIKNIVLESKPCGFVCLLTYICGISALAMECVCKYSLSCNH